MSTKRAAEDSQGANGASKVQKTENGVQEVRGRVCGCRSVGLQQAAAVCWRQGLLPAHHISHQHTVQLLPWRVHSQCRPETRGVHTHSPQLQGIRLHSLVGSPESRRLGAQRAQKLPTAALRQRRRAMAQAVLGLFFLTNPVSPSCCFFLTPLTLTGCHSSNGLSSSNHQKVRHEHTRDLLLADLTQPSSACAAPKGTVSTSCLTLSLSALPTCAHTCASCVVCFVPTQTCPPCTTRRGGWLGTLSATSGLARPPPSL